MNEPPIYPKGCEPTSALNLRNGTFRYLDRHKHVQKDWPLMLGLLTLIGDAVRGVPWGDGDGGAVTSLPQVGSVWIHSDGWVAEVTEIEGDNEQWPVEYHVHLFEGEAWRLDRFLHCFRPATVIPTPTADNWIDPAVRLPEVGDSVWVMGNGLEVPTVQRIEDYDRRHWVTVINMGEKPSWRWAPILIGPPPISREKTGAERYLADRMSDPEYRAGYEAATVMMEEMVKHMMEQDLYVINIETPEGPVKSRRESLTQWPYMLGLLTLVSNLFHGFMTVKQPDLPEVGSVWLRKDPNVPFGPGVIVVHEIGWSGDHGEANPYWYVSDTSGDSWRISEFYNLFDEAVVMSLAEYERQKRYFEDPDLLRLLAEEAEIERSTREAHDKPVQVHWPTQNEDYWHINGDLVNVQFFTNPETEQIIIRTHCYADGFDKFFSTPEEFWSLHTEIHINEY